MLAPTLADAVRAVRTKAFVILDGTLLPIDRIAADRRPLLGGHEAVEHGSRASRRAPAQVGKGSVCNSAAVLSRESGGH